MASQALAEFDFGAVLLVAADLEVQGGGAAPSNSASGGGAAASNSAPGGGAPPSNSASGGGAAPSNSAPVGGPPHSNSASGGGAAPIISRGRAGGGAPRGRGRAGGGAAPNNLLQYDLSAVLQIAVDAQIGTNPAPSPLRRKASSSYSANIRGRRAGVMREGHDSTHKRIPQAQMAAYSASGAARTADHLMPLPGVRRPLVRGKGRWKCWTCVPGHPWVSENGAGCYWRQPRTCNPERACLRACVRASVRAGVRACVRACARECLRPCSRARPRAHVRD